MRTLLILMFTQLWCFFLKIGVDFLSLLLAHEPYTDLSSITTDLLARVVVHSYYNMPFSFLILLSTSSDDSNPLPNQILWHGYWSYLYPLEAMTTLNSIQLSFTKTPHIENWFTCYNFMKKNTGSGRRRLGERVRSDGRESTGDVASPEARSCFHRP